MRKILVLEKGKKFGKWTILNPFPNVKNKQTYWTCECECGDVHQVKSNTLMNGKSTQCAKCAKKQIGLKNRKGCGDISGDMWAQMKKNATTKKMIFNVRIEEAWDVFLKQNKKCLLTGQELEFSGYPYDPEKTTAMFDTINPEQGFILGNIQWIHKDIFLIKKGMNNDAFISLCNLVYYHSS